MKKSMFLVSIVTVTLFFPLGVFAAIIHVPAEQPNIQAGIDAAVDGDTVLVADGIYTGDGNRDIDFKGKAITVASENGADSCVIDCQGTETENHRGFYFHSGETLHSVLRSFTIKNSNSPFGSIYCINSSPSVINCIISNNFAKYSGGGVCCESSSMAIIYCDIKSNTTSNLFSSGGGIACSHSSITLICCTITDNLAQFLGAGGGISCYYSSLGMTNCLISNNRSDTAGGIYSEDSSLIINNCTFADTYYFRSGAFTIKNSDFLIKNSILWWFAMDEINDHGLYSSQAVQYSDVQGGYEGTGNIDRAPQFGGCNPSDFHLMPDSPCINSGETDGASSTDLDGNPRPSGAGIDMGAYEFQWPSVPKTYIYMPDHLFEAGDSIWCKVSIWNPRDQGLVGYPLFAVLDIEGNYFCAPSFGTFDFFKWTYPHGLTNLKILPEFTWPDIAGSVNTMSWYCFLMNPEQTELASEIGIFDFGWSE
jgi:hypothetical protein